MLIPLVFWLILFASGGGTSQSIVPVPFSSLEDCRIAGEQFTSKLGMGYTYNYRCIQQRKADAFDYSNTRNNFNTFLNGENK